MESESFSVCAAACPDTSGRLEAHVFAAKNPKKRFDELMRAARAAASGKPYDGIEFEAANKWLAGVVSAGREQDVRLVVLAEGFQGQNATKLPKLRYERDLLALGVRLPLSGQEDRDAELDAIRESFKKADIKLPSNSMMALREISRQCNEELSAGTGAGAWPDVTIEFNVTGEVHRQVMNLINELLLCCGYNLRFNISKSGSAKLVMRHPDDDDSLEGDVKISLGLSDRDGCGKIELLDGRRQWKTDEARLLSMIASVDNLIAWRKPLIENAIDRELVENPSLLDYASEGKWNSEPALHLPGGDEWFPSGVLELADGSTIRSPENVSGRDFLAWAKSMGKRLSFSCASKHKKAA